MARENQAGNLTVALHRLDGKAAGLTFAPAQGPAPRWGGDGVRVDDDRDGLFSTAESVRAALEDDAGDALARVIAARDAMGRDRDGARGLLAGLPAWFSRAMRRSRRCVPASRRTTRVVSVEAGRLEVSRESTCAPSSSATWSIEVTVRSTNSARSGTVTSTA